MTCPFFWSPRTLHLHLLFQAPEYCQLPKCITKMIEQAWNCETYWEKVLILNCCSIFNSIHYWIVQNEHDILSCEFSCPLFYINKKLKFYVKLFWIHIKILLVIENFCFLRCLKLECNKICTLSAWVSQQTEFKECSPNTQQSEVRVCIRNVYESVHANFSLLYIYKYYVRYKSCVRIFDKQPTVHKCKI